MRKLKASEVAGVREDLLTKQGKRCAICQLPCTSSAAVLDHDHHTGVVRGAAHRGCNAVEGKVVNSYKRYGVPNLAAFLHGLPAYHAKHATDQTGLLHPTFLTEDEKRIKRNTKARKARAAKKEVQ